MRLSVPILLHDLSADDECRNTKHFISYFFLYPKSGLVINFIITICLILQRRNKHLIIFSDIKNVIY